MWPCCCCCQVPGVHEGHTAGGGVHTAAHGHGDVPRQGGTQAAPLPQTEVRSTLQCRP